MNIKMSDSLDESYGNTPMEQLTNIIFECKEGIDSEKYAIMNELLLKVNKACNFESGATPHYFNFRIQTILINATDAIKEDLDYCADNYNSDYEDYHDWEDEEDLFYINTDIHCKIYLDYATNRTCLLDFYSDFHDIIESSFKNKKSYVNYQTCLNVGYEKHLKEVAKRVKDNIDYEWVKIKETHVQYLSVKPISVAVP